MTTLGNPNILEAFEKMDWYTQQMLKNNWMLWFPSHHPILDKFTSGIIPWKVYMIAAYSNVWKSRFSYWYVNYFLKQWKKVVFISLEVDKGLLINHLCCNMYNCYKKELHNWMIDYFDFQNLYIYDDVYKLSWIEEIIMTIKPDICVIDFVQNIQVDWVWWYEAMSMVARKIQEIAIKSNTTLICLSQLSNSVARDVSAGKTDFIALKGAWEFIASSDVVMLLRMVDDTMGITITKTKFAAKPQWELFFTVNFGKSQFTAINDPFINKDVF